MKLYTTAASKRGMAKAIGTFDPATAMDWYEAAALIDAGPDADAAYEAALQAWKDAKPTRLDFLPPDVRVALTARRNELEAKARAEVEAIWGPVLTDDTAARKADPPQDETPTADDTTTTHTR